MKVALIQFKPKLSRSNLERHIEILSQLDEVDIAIFPELSLNGYYLQDGILEDSWKIEELHEIAKISTRFDIVVGGAVKEGKKIFNSSLYFSEGKLLHHHRKIHLPNRGLFEEKRFYDSGNEIESFQTRFGVAVSLVCEDIWRGSTFAKIEELSPDFITIISNSPARGFRDGKIEIVEKWKSLLQTASIVAKATTIFVNRVGFEDGLGFWGGSMVFGDDGNERVQLPLYQESITIVEI